MTSAAAMFCWYYSGVEQKGVSLFSGADSADASQVRLAAVADNSVSLLRRLLSAAAVSCVAASCFLWYRGSIAADLRSPTVGQEAMRKNTVVKYSKRVEQFHHHRHLICHIKRTVQHKEHRE